MPDWLLTCMNYDDWMMSYTLQLYGHRTYHYMHCNTPTCACRICTANWMRDCDGKKSWHTYRLQCRSMWHTNVRLLRINFAIQFLLQICKKILHVWFIGLWNFYLAVKSVKNCNSFKTSADPVSCVQWRCYIATCVHMSYQLPCNQHAHVAESSLGLHCTALICSNIFVNEY